jgi:hypothetical protein
MKKSLLVACKRGVLCQYTVASCNPILLLQPPIICCGARVCFSNRPVRVKRFQTIRTTVATSPAGSCFSTESAPGPYIMGSEDEGNNL